MSKKIVQDVLPPNEKSIRRIPLSDRKQNRIFPSERQEDKKNLTPPKKRGRFKYWIWGLGILAIIILIRVFAFTEAQVTIVPKQQTVSLNETFLASKEVLTDEAIPFEVMKISEEKEMSMQSVGEEVVEKKASGEITIFNRHSTSPQQLVQNTRFETPEGLIYRINESVTVPGATEENGELVPGQIKVRVFADKPGEEYNIGLKDFTIPGFAGLPQFENFFARSETGMTGGFVGTVKTVDPENLESTRRQFQDELENILREKIELETPDGFILLRDTLEITFENVLNEEGSESVRIKEIGSARVLIINKEKMESAIAKEILLTDEEININNIKDLQISTDIESEENLSNLSSFEFTVAGEAEAVWFIDEEKIKRELSGQPIRNLQSLLSQYPAVQEAEVSAKPFWKRSFPKNESRIHVEIR